MVTISNRRITKRNEIQCFLLTDLFIYAKPTVEKKTGILLVCSKESHFIVLGAKKYIVYKSIHRALVLAETYEPILTNKADSDTNFFTVTLLAEGVQPEPLIFKAKSEYGTPAISM